jgi:hypothetical protein
VIQSPAAKVPATVTAAVLPAIIATRLTARAPATVRALPSDEPAEFLLYGRKRPGQR